MLRAAVTDVLSVRVRPLLLQLTFASSAANGENRNDIRAACWLAWLILAPSCSEETGLKCPCVCDCTYFSPSLSRHLFLISLIRTGSVHVVISRPGPGLYSRAPGINGLRRQLPTQSKAPLNLLMFTIFLFSKFRPSFL